MKIKANQLKPGMTLASGETVKGATKVFQRSTGARTPKIAITVAKPDGRLRQTLVGYNSTIFCKG